MAYQYFDASWVDVYNASGGWSKKHSNHPIRTGGGSGTNWQSFIRIPDAVKTAAKQSTTSPSLDMQIYFSSASSEIDVGYHRTSSSRSVGASGVPWYAYSETWRSIGTGWMTYGMSNWFLPNFLSGNTQGIVLYSYNGKFSNTAYGLGTSYNVRFRVTGTWNTAPSTPGSARVDKTVADINQTFRWNASSDSEQSTSALRYQVEFYNGSSWNRVENSYNGTSRVAATVNATETTRARYRVRAYDGELYSGWAYSPYFEIKHVAPSFSSSQISYVDRNSTTTGITGNNQDIIQNASLPRAYVNTGASGNDGKSIVRYTFTLGGQEKSRTSTGYVDFGILDASYNQTLRVTAEDSAGLKTSVTKSVKIIPYEKPSLQYSAKRVGSMSDETILKLSGSISPLGGKNSLGTTRFRYKTASGSYGSYQSFPRTVSGNSFSTTDRTLTLDNTQPWVIHIQVSDTLGTRDIYVNLNSGRPITFVDVDLDSFGVGRFPTRARRFEVENDVYIKGDMNLEGGIELNSAVSSDKPSLWIKGNAGDHGLRTRGIDGANANGTLGDLYLNYNSDADIRVGAAGDIIADQGQNADGYWYRFYNGVQVCIMAILVGETENPTYLESTTGLRRSNPYFTVPFPAQFGSSPTVMFTHRYGSPIWFANDNVSTTAVRGYLYSPISRNNTGWTAIFTAVGRWK